MEATHFKNVVPNQNPKWGANGWLLKVANGECQDDQSNTISVFQKTKFGIYPSK